MRAAPRPTAAVAAAIALVVAAACDGGGAADTTLPVTIAASAPADATAETTIAGTSTAAPPATTDTPAPGTTPGSVVAGGTPTTDADLDVPLIPRAGGTLRYGLEADVDGLNPTSSVLSAPGQLMANAVFDSLTAFDTEGRVVPYLAESLTPVDGDLSKWRITLRQNITFHDGEPLNAAAVQINLEAQLASPLIGLGSRPFYPDENPAEVIDEFTIQYNLRAPNAVFPATLTSQVGSMASPLWLEAALADPALNQRPVGTGPFRFDSRTPDSITRFVRNDDWWGGDVLLDAIEFVPVSDPDTRVDLLVNGELTALHTTNPASIRELRNRADVTNIVEDAGEESFVMLNAAKPPFDDIRARRALALATPRTNYIELIGLGIARQADQIFTPESVYYNPDVVQEGDRPDEAVTLAAEYCADVPDQCSGDKINMEYQWFGPAVVQTRIAELFDQAWSVAFNVTFDELVQDSHIQQTALGQYDATLWRQFGSGDPAQERVSLICRTIGAISLNFPRYCSEARDALIAQATAELDQAARVPLWQQISQDIHDSYTYIFLQHTLWDNAFDASVHGVCDRTSPEGAALLCAANGRTWFSSVWLDT